MRRIAKSAQKLVAMICILALLPIGDFTSMCALAEPGTAQSLPVYENAMISQTLTINQDTVFKGDVTLTQGAQIVVENGTLTIQPGAHLRGNVLLSGAYTRLAVGGELIGDVLLTGEHASVDVGGSVQGKVTVSHDGPRALGRMFETVRTQRNSYVETLVLDGSGYATIQGSVGLLDTTAANKTRFEFSYGHADAIYVRSDTDAFVDNGASVDLLVLEGEQCTFEKQGYVANISLNDNVYAKTVQILSGFADIGNGAHVDNLYLTGRRAEAHLEVFNDVSEATPSIDEAYIYGREAHLMARGEIGYCYMENGLLSNHGHIRTLVMNGGYFQSETGGVVSEHEYPYIADRFPVMYDELIMLRGDGELRNKVVIDRTVMMGGSFSTNSVERIKPLINARSLKLSKSEELNSGVISAKRGDVYTISADAFAALGVSVFSAEDGGVLIDQPADRYTWLDTANGTDSATMMAQEAGEYTLTVMCDAELTVTLDPPVAVAVALSSRSAAAKGEEAVVEPVALSSVEMVLTNETSGKKIDYVRSGDTLYALPETAQPGDVVSLAIDGAETAVLMLDGRRAAKADMEIVEDGRYVGTPKDDARAHLYLYDASGCFEREVFYRSGKYCTGALPEGSYYAVWVRGGVNGWKLPRIGDFASNGLREGEHYLCEPVTIEKGVVLRTAPDIPEEPALQSPWLDAGKTAYRALSQTVVEGDLVLMSLEYAISDETAGAAKAKIDFLKGASFVEGSASINGKLTNAAWDGNSLTADLTEREGKLMFYMRGRTGAKSLTSSASIVFVDQGNTAQYVGSAQTVIAPLSITAPELTSESNVFVYGYALPYSVVAVYDGERIAAYSVANGAGMWNSHVELTSETSHVLTIRTEDGEAVSEPVVVRRAAGTPVLKMFTVEYMEHGVARRIDIPGERFGRDVIRFSYEPDTDIAFTLAFDNDELVESISLVAEQNGHREELPLTKTADGVWSVVNRLSKDKAFTPDLFTIQYTFREDALGKVFAQTYADVPLMDVLYMAQDIGDDLILNRYYMAAPAYHGVDIGFGSGWLTNYTVLAQIETDKDGVQTVAVFSPTSTRWFTGVGGKLTEAAGYAKASIKKDMLTVTEADGSILQFDAEGRLIKVTDPYANAMEIVYCQKGYLLSVKTEDAEIIFTYGEDGHILSARCGDKVVEYTYEKGRLLYANKDNGTSIYTYDGLHTQSGTLRLNSVNDESGVSQFTYDSYGRIVMLHSGQDSMRIDYGVGEITLTMGDQSATYQLNESGVILGGAASDGSAMKVKRTRDGARLIISDARGRISEIATNDKGDIIREIDAIGNTVSYTYDDVGNQTSVTDQLGNTTRYQYDQKGELTRITYADGSAESWKYDKQGNILSYTDRAGNATTYTYDKEGFLTRVSNPDGTRLEVRTSENDEGGYYSEMHLGEEWASIYTSDNHNSYHFDGYDYHEGVEYPSLVVNDVGTNSHSNRNMLYGVSALDGSMLIEYVYDKQERLSLEKMGNGAYTAYAYAENGVLARRENHAPDGRLLSFDAFEYDEYGNIIRLETEEGVWEYGYDNIGQLTRIFAPDGTETFYVYDAAGNRASKCVSGVTTRYTVNELNQYTQVGDTAYTYDKNGNLIREEGPGVTKEYTWNKLNQLVEVSDGQNVTQYTYDLFGNRSSMTQNGETTTYHTAPTELSMMLKQEDALGETTYLYGDSGLAGARWNGQQVYYTFNYLGSVKEIMDAQGNVLCSYDYDYEGNVVGEWVYTAEDAALPEQQQMAELAHAMNVQQLRYVGRYGIMDDGNGMHYARARYIHDADNRFASPDPAGQAYGINLYCYALNNPIRYSDITGRAYNENIFGVEGNYKLPSESRGSLIGRVVVGIAGFLLLFAGGWFAVLGVVFLLTALPVFWLPAEGAELETPSNENPNKPVQPKPRSPFMTPPPDYDPEEFDQKGCAWWGGCEVAGTIANNDDGTWPDGDETSVASTTASGDDGTWPDGDETTVASTTASGDDGTWLDGDETTVASTTASGDDGTWPDGDETTVASTTASGDDGTWPDGDETTVASTTASGDDGTWPDGDETTVASTTASGDDGTWPDGDETTVASTTASGDDGTWPDGDETTVASTTASGDDGTWPDGDETTVASTTASGDDGTWPDGDETTVASTTASGDDGTWPDGDETTVASTTASGDDGTWPGGGETIGTVAFDPWTDVNPDALVADAGVNPLWPTIYDVSPISDFASVPASQPPCKPTLDPEPNPDVPNGPYPGPSSPTDITVDPSGYVFEAVPSNRVEGVTATVYYRAEDGTAILWDAGEFNQVNPQLTDFLGQYAWYVPVGEWRVVYEKDGYETTQTGWLPVPPPQTEVNVEIVSRVAPQVTHTALFADGIEVTFSKYMDIASVQQAVCVMNDGGGEIIASVEPLNAEQMVSEDRMVASRFLISAQDLNESVQLTIDEKAVSYAGTPLQVYTGIPKRAYRLENLGLEAEYMLSTDSTAAIDVQAAGEGGFTGMNLVAELAGGSCITGGFISVLDENGHGVLTIHTGSTGRATLRIRETVSGYEEVIQLMVSPEPAYLYEATVATRGNSGISLWANPERKESQGDVRKGETVQVLEEADNGWVRIRYSELEGYTMLKYLEKK